VEDGKIKVLVVDDSALMRRIISEIVEEDSSLTVVGTAKDGLDAIKMVKELKPDVITLDVNMPRMDGQKTLSEIMSKHPTPIIMLSAYTKADAEVTLTSLRDGAVDFLQKPSGEISIDLEFVKDQLLDKIKIASKSNIEAVQDPGPVPEKEYGDIFEGLEDVKHRVVVVGASTGGPPVIEQIVHGIEASLSVPVVIAQHMPEMFVTSFVERIAKNSAVQVKEAEEGEELVPGVVYIVPGDRDTKLEKSNGGLGKKAVFKFSKDRDDNRGKIYPSVDYLFESAADIYARGTLGIILSGMGKDGADGVKKIRQQGGKNLTQNRESSLIFGMPGEAFKTGCIDEVMFVEGLINAINSFGNL